MIPILLQQHLIDSGASHGVVIILDPTLSVYDCLSRQSTDGTVKQIILVPVVNKFVYAIGMHELGHCCSPGGALHHGDRSNRLLLLQSEQNAWTWAEGNATYWDEEMREFAKKALLTYTHKEPIPHVPGFAPPPSVDPRFALLAAAMGYDIPLRPQAQPPAPTSNPVLEQKHEQVWRKGLAGFGARIKDSRRKK